MSGTISAMYAGGVLALACATTWVILYLHAKYDKMSELAYVAYMMIWLEAIMLFVAKFLGF